jgi:hypothetical protein
MTVGESPVIEPGFYANDWWRASQPQGHCTPLQRSSLQASMSNRVRGHLDIEQA